MTISSSRVSMLDTRSGAVVRTTRIPFAPDPEFHDLIVYVQAGRTYLTSFPPDGQQSINTGLLLDTHTGSVVGTVSLPEPSA